MHESFGAATRGDGGAIRWANKDRFDATAMSKALDVVQKAAAIRLDFGEDVLTFPYTTSAGEEWRGCLEEWIGNDTKPLQLDAI